MAPLKAFIAKFIAVIIQPLVGLLVAAAVAYFIYGVAMFLWNAENSDERKKGTQHMLWGVIGIVIMVAAIGIIKIALATFGCSLTGGFASC